MEDIFVKTKNWSFSERDLEADQKFHQLLYSTLKHLPHHFYIQQTLKHNHFVIASQIYSKLQTIPKGVCHHNHYDTNEDLQFYQKYVMNLPNIYISPDYKSIKFATKIEAEKQNLISLSEAKKQFQNEQLFSKALLNITTFSSENINDLSGKRKAWPAMEQKILAFHPILNTVNLCKLYFLHVCRKYINNGYDRLQFRVIIPQLKQFDMDGNLINTYDLTKFKQVIDEGTDQIKKQHESFSVGFIAFGLKFLTPEQNQGLLSSVCQMKWNKVIGLDFVQQQDLYGSLEPYCEIMEKILKKYQNLNLKKVYHAGETKMINNNNVEIAIKSGSVRIGHGINIVQKPYLLEVLKANVCFEICPVSNIFLGYNQDSRYASGNILMNLGVPVTINPDDPSKFNCKDTTLDYFIATVSYGWGLKHLKLLAIHSINHAICDEDTRKLLLLSFQKRWKLWIEDYLKDKQLSK